jgi:Spy/CpxP family protein refolding chaperone
MLGVIIGTVCTIGLLRVARRAFGGRRAFWGRTGGCGGSPWSGGGFGGRRREFGMMRWLFERLETTPGQERAIMEAFARMRKDQGTVRQELAATREDLARVIEGGLIDDAALEETFARHDRLLAALRVSFVETMKTVGETLDPNQRKAMADLLKRRGWLGTGWAEGSPNGVWA